MPRRFAALLAPLILLAACYADLDWREVRPADAGFVVMLPGRVVAESRPLPAAHSGATLHQWSSRARQSLFAAGYADVAAPRAAALDTLRNALVANIGGKVETERDIVAGDLRGRETIASGTAAGGPVTLRLRLYERGSRVYQVVLLGRPGDLSEDEMDSFFGSFRLRDAPK